MKKKFLFPLMTLFAGTLVTSCSKDDKAPMGQTESGTLMVENVSQVKDFVQSGTFKGMGDPPVIFPGQSVSIKFNAGKGQYLAFATMYGASKDWFFAPENPGLKLYNDNGSAKIGDVSEQIKLWDNGSKNNMTGATESQNISQVPGVDASSLMKLDLAYNSEKSEFTLTIKNTSGGTMNETPFSPGVWAVSNVLGGTLLNKMPFFEAGKMSNPEITKIAEGGDITPAAAKIMTNTGIFTGLSPVVVVVYSGTENPIFKIDEKDMGNGLKEVAQTGDPSKLKTSLSALKNVKQVYVLGDAPIAPGGKVTSSIKGDAGDKIAFVTMFGYSNDWFYGNNSELMFTSKGDLTSKVVLYDNGSALDQYPGAGNAQALFGGVPIVQSHNIQMVGNEFSVPTVDKILKIKIN